MTGQRRSLLVAALGFALAKSREPELALVRSWLNNWTGLGIVVEGMARQGFDLTLARYGDARPSWRALFYPASFLHVARAGSAWGEKPWRAVQRAAWQALTAQDGWHLGSGR